MPFQRIAIALAGLSALLTPLAQANDCKTAPPAELAPAPAQGVHHMGRPQHLSMSRQGKVLVTANGWDYTSMLRGTTAPDGRIIVWDGDTLTPRHVLAQSADRVPPIPGATPRTSGVIRIYPGFFPFSVSPDGRYLAFSLGEAGASCVDVYDNGRHLIRYDDRTVVTFYGDQLLLGELDKKERVRGIYLQPVGGKREKKSLDMLFQGKPQKTVNHLNGLFAADNGQAVLMTTTFTSRGDARYGVVELGAWQPQPVQMTNRPNILRVSTPAQGAAHYQITAQIDRPFHKVVQVPLQLRISPSVIQNPREITGHITSDNTVLALWRTDGKRDGSGRDGYYGQVFQLDTGLPVHPVPLVLPPWSVNNGQDAPHAVMLDDTHLLLMPAATSYLQAEKINVFTSEPQTVTMMQTPSDARRLVEASQARQIQLNAQAAAQRERTATLNRNPVIRKVHEQGGPADAYEAELYCRMGGPRCTQVRLQARQQQNQQNSAAFADQMRRAWEIHDDGVDVFQDARRHRECVRRRDNPTAVADPEFAGQSVGTCLR